MRRIKELMSRCVRRIIQRDDNDAPKDLQMTTNYALSNDDAQQVHAILMTHAEMQDRAAIENEQIRGRMTRDQVDEEMVLDLVDVHEDMQEDRDNLHRIAKIFE